MHLSGAGFVLDQLDQFALPDYLAGADGDILANREGIGIGHLDGQLALAPFHVVEHVLQAAHQVFALAFDCLAQHFRIGGDKVGWRHGIGELTGIEIHLLGVFRAQSVHVVHRVMHPAGSEQVGLLDEIKYLVALPILGAKTFVALLWRNDRFAGLSQHALGRILPKLHVVLPQRHLRLGQLFRIRQHLGGQLHEGGADIQGIGIDLAAILGLLLQKIVHQTLALFGHLDHIFGEFVRLLFGLLFGRGGLSASRVVAHGLSDP